MVNTASRATRLSKYLTQEELGRFFAAIPSPRDRALFAVIYHYGLRVDEATALTLEDLDLRTHRILPGPARGQGLEIHVRPEAPHPRPRARASATCPCTEAPTIPASTGGLVRELICRPRVIPGLQAAAHQQRLSVGIMNGVWRGGGAGRGAETLT